MAQTTSPASVGDLALLIPSFERSLRATNKSSRTVGTYGDAARQLLSFLAANGMPTDVEHIKREHVEAFIEQLLATKKPSTAQTRYRSLAQLFKYLAEEGDITKNPMVNMKPPRIPEEIVPVLPQDDLRSLGHQPGRPVCRAVVGLGVQRVGHHRCNRLRR